MSGRTEQPCARCGESRRREGHFAAQQPGFLPGTYRGVIADASPANTNNYVRVEQHSAVIHLEAISSIVLPN
jgi:hypothetical protein